MFIGRIVLKSKIRSFCKQIPIPQKWNKYLIIASTLTLSTLGIVLYEKVLGNMSKNNPKYLRYMFCSKDLIKSMIKTDQAVLKDIPVDCLTDDICEYAVSCDPNCIASIPESFRSDELRKSALCGIKYLKCDIEPALKILLEKPLMFIEENCLSLLSDEEINNLVDQNETFKHAYTIHNRQVSQFSHIKNNYVKTEHIYEGWDWGKPQHKTTTADAKKAALP